MVLQAEEGRQALHGNVVEPKSYIDLCMALRSEGGGLLAWHLLVKKRSCVPLVQAEMERSLYWIVRVTRGEPRDEVGLGERIQIVILELAVDRAEEILGAVIRELPEGVEK